MPSIPRSAWKVMCLALVIPCITAACAVRAAPKGTGSAVTPSAADDWTRVTQLPRRAKLTVTDGSGQSAAGHFLRADATHLTLLNRDTEVVFEKSLIATVILEEHQGWGKAKRGFRFGALAGGLFGGVTTKSAAWSAMLAAGWGTFGFFIGAIDGANEIRRVLIYAATDRH
jgi:hypothetical protein